MDVSYGQSGALIHFGDEDTRVEQLLGRPEVRKNLEPVARNLGDWVVTKVVPNLGEDQTYFHEVWVKKLAT